MNPEECKTKSACRISEKYTPTTTLVDYPPIYDGNGLNINPEGNITFGAIRCSTCNRTWSYSRKYDRTTYTEIKE